MKVSVIMPSLNQAGYISTSISSVIHQEGNFEVELMVMDGGSADETTEILKEYERKIRQSASARITFLWRSEKDKGQAEGINKGLRQSRGDILAFMNSDDSYAPGAFQKVVDFFARNPDIMWLTGKCRIIDRNDREIRKWVTAYKNFLLKNYCYPLLLTENFLSQPATFWRRKTYEEFGDFDESLFYCLDHEYWLRLGQKHRPGFIDDYLAHFRLHSASKSAPGHAMRFGEELGLVRRFGKSRGFLLFLFMLNFVKIVSAYGLMRRLGK